MAQDALSQLRQEKLDLDINLSLSASYEIVIYFTIKQDTNHINKFARWACPEVHLSSVQRH